MMVVAVVGAATALMARHDRARADRHQEGARVLDGQPARLHVPGLRRGRLRGGRLPPLHPRLLQGAALPRLGLGDPRAGRRAGHAADGRPAAARSRGRSGPSWSARWPSPASRCSPASTARTRSWPARSRRRPARSCSAIGARHRAADRLLHGAAAVPDLLRRVPRAIARRAERHVHESPLVACWSPLRACWPLGSSVAAGYVDDRPHFVQPVVSRLRGRSTQAHHPRWLPVVATAGARCSGIAAAFYLYRALPATCRARLGAPLRALARRARGQVRLRRRSTTGSWPRVVVAAASALLWRGVDAG